MARRGATALPVLSGSPGSSKFGGGGGVGKARSKVRMAVMWVANTALALTAGSAIAITAAGELIAWLASAPVWLLVHLLDLIPDVPLIPVIGFMAVVVFLMFGAIVCDVVDGKVDSLAVWCFVLLGSFGLAATGFPADWAAWITAHVNAWTIGPVSSFFGG